MCLKAYGKEDPSQNDIPLQRSDTVKYYKKALSYWMNSMGPWDPNQETGNPTRSKKVNDLLKVLKRLETRGVGAPAQADRAFTIGEFKQIMELFGGDSRHKAMCAFQYHMMGRIDDTAHVKKSSLKASMQYPGYLTAKIVWSKNIRDESNCPEQILLPSSDPTTCVYLQLAIWLEEWLQYGDGALSQWLFAEGRTTDTSPTPDQDKEAVNCKRGLSRLLKKILDSEAFTKDGPGNLGSHSTRKLSVSEARRRGAPKDDVDYRARWILQRMQDRYTDIQLNWPDINCASLLCLNGAINYVLKQGAGLTDNWLAHSIAPAITSCFGEKIGAILAKPLLWAAFDQQWQEKLPSDIRHRIISRFVTLQRPGFGDGVNPVKKVEVIANQVGGAVTLDRMNLDEDENGNELQEPLTIARDSAQYRAAVFSRLGSIVTTVAETQTFATQELLDLKQRVKKLQEEVRNLSYAPARVVLPATERGTHIIEGSTEQGQDPRPATLCRNPRHLAILWDEYQNGVAGRLPARLFTAEQRGRCRAKYSQRKVFWDCMQRLIDNGCTAQTALHRIAAVYSGSVTNKLKALLKDERRGGHTNLCPFSPGTRRRGRNSGWIRIRGQ